MLSAGERQQICTVRFHRFKAFRDFVLDVKHFNVLVGPNNAGKSTILTAFRILAAALRKASAKSATPLRVQGGTVLGYDVELGSISVAEENIFFNYDASSPAEIEFVLSNKNSLTLFFPEEGGCYLIPDAHGKNYTTPKLFKALFDCPISFVPKLGPIEHHEPLYEKEAARLALFNYRAARNFRNIWFYYRDHFDTFRVYLDSTWSGMDIALPEVDRSYPKPRLFMYCTEKRISRELFWSGFGFQVWCQMLTHLIQSKNSSLFLIDEPDIYLHSDLQRHLVGLLKKLGPDIMIATHSTEIIVEADASDIVLVNKGRQRGRRLRDPLQLEGVFSELGSSINPILTQLAKTRRALFVEGQDFAIIGKFARRLGADAVANRRDFAVIPVDGFNPERIRSLKDGMELTLGTKIAAAAIFDRDYRSDAEAKEVVSDVNRTCDLSVIHGVKEVENFLLVPTAIERAAIRKAQDRSRRSGAVGAPETCPVGEIIIEYTNSKKSYTLAQHIEFRRRFERSRGSHHHNSQINQQTLEEFDKKWATGVGRVGCVGGKDCLRAINAFLQDKHGLSVTPAAIIDAMTLEEVPREVAALINALGEFATKAPPPFTEA